MADVTVYCPRCDRAFSAPLKRDAFAKMHKHLKKEDPAYYESYKDADNKDV